MDKFYVLGKFVTNSYSPKLFKIIFDQLQITKACYKYKNFDNNELDIFLNNKCFKGANITSPFKKNIIQYLNFKDKIVEELDSCNCVVNKQNQLFGYNTDCYGFEKLLRINNLFNKKLKFLIFGSGGSVNSIIWVLNKLGCKDVTMVYRNDYRFKLITKKFTMLKIHGIKYENLFQKHIINHDIIINATSILRTSIYKKKFMINSKINDVVALDLQYSKTKTPFLDLFNDGIKKIDGVDMLIFQAFESLDIWFEGSLSKNLNYNDIKLKLIKE